AILDSTDPQTVLWRSEEALWEQTRDWKKTKVQPVGIIQFQDSLYSYWSFGTDGIFAINFNLKRQIEIINQGLHPTLQKHHKNPILTSRVHLPWESQAT